MLPSPVPADPGWDEDLAWLDRDPEREVWLARAREHDEPPGEDEEYEDYAPLTAEELAGIQEAAADELLAVKAATTRRRGPEQPGSARTFPGESRSPAAAFGPGMVLDVLPGCAAAANPKTTWCLTVTDGQGHAVAHGCARPEPKKHAKHAGPGPPPDGTRFTFTPAGRDAPPGGYGTWRLTTPGDGPDLIITIDPITTDPCDHRFQAKGHDPGVKLRHLSQVRHATCTSPICRPPAAQCDVEHNTPYEAGGRTCLCNTGPKCRHDHRLKQHPKWHVDQLPDGTFRWTTPAGRTYDTEPTRYPI